MDKACLWSGSQPWCWLLAFLWITGCADEKVPATSETAHTVEVDESTTVLKTRPKLLHAYDTTAVYGVVDEEKWVKFDLASGTMQTVFDSSDFITPEIYERFRSLKQRNTPDSVDYRYISYEERKALPFNYYMYAVMPYVQYLPEEKSWVFLLNLPTPHAYTDTVDGMYMESNYHFQKHSPNQPANVFPAQTQPEKLLPPLEPYIFSAFGFHLQNDSSLISPMFSISPTAFKGRQYLANFRGDTTGFNLRAYYDVAFPEPLIDQNGLYDYFWCPFKTHHNQLYHGLGRGIFRLSDAKQMYPFTESALQNRKLVDFFIEKDHLITQSYDASAKLVYIDIFTAEGQLKTSKTFDVTTTSVTWHAPYILTLSKQDEHYVLQKHRIAF